MSGSPIRVEPGKVDSTEGALSPIHAIAMMKRCLTVEKLAEILECDKSKIYKLVRSGRLQAIKIDSMIRLDPATVATYLRTRLTT